MATGDGGFGRDQTFAAAAANSDFAGRPQITDQLGSRKAFWATSPSPSPPDSLMEIDGELER